MQNKMNIHGERDGCKNNKNKTEQNVFLWLDKDGIVFRRSDFGVVVDIHDDGNAYYARATILGV